MPLRGGRLVAPSFDRLIEVPVYAWGIRVRSDQSVSMHSHVKGQLVAFTKVTMHQTNGLRLPFADSSSGSSSRSNFDRAEPPPPSRRRRRRRRHGPQPQPACFGASIPLWQQAVGQRRDWNVDQMVWCSQHTAACDVMGVARGSSNGQRQRIVDGSTPHHKHPHPTYLGWCCGMMCCRWHPP